MRVAAAAFVALLLATVPASACSMAPVFQNGGRYVGGDLVTQIAERADTIQIVRAVHRMPISTNARGDRVYAFQFEVVATLARRGGGVAPGSFSLDGYERVAVASAEGLQRFDDVWLTPDAINHPGSSDGYWQLRAPGPASLNRSSCGWPMQIALREEFVVLRQASGQLYAFSGIESADESGPHAPRPLDVEFTYRPNSRVIETAASPPLVRIESRRDVFLVELQAALSRGHRSRN